MLTPELKEKWIKALRSGDYLQGQSYLRRGARFCCLGVLADVLGAGWEPSGVRGEEVLSPFGQDGSCLKAHPQFLKEDIIPMKVQLKLSDMNDQGRPFLDIADWIENSRDNF